MTYSDFTLEQLEDEFGINNQVQVFEEFENVTLIIEISDWLKKSLAIAKELPYPNYWVFFK